MQRGGSPFCKMGYGIVNIPKIGTVIGAYMQVDEKS